jgi:hypothetical protein
VFSILIRKKCFGALRIRIDKLIYRNSLPAFRIDGEPRGFDHEDQHHLNNLRNAEKVLSQCQPESLYNNNLTVSKCWNKWHRKIVKIPVFVHALIVHLIENSSTNGIIGQLQNRYALGGKNFLRRKIFTVSSLLCPNVGWDLKNISNQDENSLQDEFIIFQPLIPVFA